MQHDDERFKAHLDDWAKGDFTQSDEKALKTLTDPDNFRREAMEGFAAVPEEDHAARLASMRSRLKKDQPALTGSRVRPMYWAAAATIAVLIGAFFFLRDNTGTINGKIAQNSPVSPADYSADSIQDGLAATGSAPARSSEALKSERDFAAKPTLPSGESALEKSRTSVSGGQKAFDDADLAAAPSLPAEETITIANEEKSTEKEDKIAATKQAESIPVPTQLPATPGAIVVKPTSRAKDSEFSKKKSHRTEDKANMDSLRALVRASELPTQSQPVGGWEEWNTYLRQNARLTPEARNNNISGSVVLQFSIDSNGDPLNPFFLRRLGYGCDEEAIRLIRSWEWVSGKNNFIKVEIFFVR